MKFLFFTLACITTAAAAPTAKTWTMHELSEAIEKNMTEPELRPYLTDALNKIMLAIFTGVNVESIQAYIRAPDGGYKWTKEQIKNALKDPDMNPHYRNFFTRAFFVLEDDKSLKTVEVMIPALDISTWTMPDLDEALNNETTNPKLLPYLEKARDALKKDIGKRDKITIVTQVGLVKTNESNIISNKLARSDA